MKWLVFVFGGDGQYDHKLRGPLLNLSIENTNAGRVPACSRPMVGSRLISHTSPREGWDVLIGFRVRR